MKISIVSTYSYIKTNVNYGSALQCYALQKYLIKRGHEPEHLRDYRANPILILKRLKNVRYFQLFCLKLKSQLYMNRFVKDYLKLSNNAYFSEKTMFRKPPEADCFIAGSDQIWRNANGSRFLNFAPDKATKITYAASFGRQSLPEQMVKTISPWLKRLDGISVRENTAVDMVNEITDKKAIRVLDPTLLLNMEEYPYKEVKKNNFYYCYFLNLESKNNVCFDSIKKYAQNKGKELIITAPINYPQFSTDNLLFPSVEEWLGHYKKADCVFTNTYHGMLFCIIFKKQFLFFVQKGTGSAENDRFYSLMSMLHLEDRMVSEKDAENIGEKMEKRIDYEQVYEVIYSERKRTDAFFEQFGI